MPQGSSAVRPTNDLYLFLPILLVTFNPLNTELNPICHLLALLGGAIIVVVSRLRVNDVPTLFEK